MSQQMREKTRSGSEANVMAPRVWSNHDSGPLSGRSDMVGRDGVAPGRAGASVKKLSNAAELFTLCAFDALGVQAFGNSLSRLAAHADCWRSADRLREKIPQNFEFRPGR